MLMSLYFQKFLEQERSGYEKFSQLEAELHQQQEKRRQELLKHLMQQQNESDTLVMKMQLEKDSERIKLIDDILKGKQLNLRF